MEVMLCCDDIYLRSDVTQRPSFDCPPCASLHPEIEMELARLLVLEIDYHIKLNACKAKLTQRKEWTNLQGFRAVDRCKEGFIGFNSIFDFCASYGFKATEIEIFSIIRRIDFDADSRITYPEFDEFMNTNAGKCPKSKGFKEDFKLISPRKTVSGKKKSLKSSHNSKASMGSLHSRKKSTPRNFKEPERCSRQERNQKSLIKKKLNPTIERERTRTPSRNY